MDIFIVEDDTMILENLTILLGGEPDIEVTGSFTNGEDALQALHNIIALEQINSKTKPSPDIILVDIGLPGISGIEFIQSAKTLIPDIEFMAYTVFEDKNNIFAAIKAGASGYILKGCTPRELVEALFNLHQGGAPMSPRIARALINEFRTDALPEQFLLTGREKEVLTHLEKGLTYKEIAEVCTISSHTVHSHIKNIYEKLHATSRKEALIKARKKGIII
jgi:DNA-binding NarL/FixJ family response regulator